jgi:hypothetical protein
MVALYWEAKQRAANCEWETAEKMAQPSMMLRPRLSVDSNQWCALYGEDLQTGVAGFGASPEKAYADFDRAWRADWPTVDGGE